ncbi:Pou and Homeobox domain containing protein [Trichuris trichiura]|uniref:POU domain protein n=1 Tax=Trichuris trichiura TaxID=36087 RepID=A0A077Z1W0_TRITR|nr:Pou and Homeobox domain containing protein [Trichuris trichiura]
MNRRRASRLAKRFQPTKNGNSDEIPSTAPSNDPHLSHLESLEFFAAHFRQKRIALGYTQQQVGDTLGRRYNSYFSQTTISRFEDLNLSVRNMSKLRPLIEQWIADTESAAAKGASIADEQNQDDQQQQQQQTANGNGATIRRRRKRTTIDNRMRSFLESVFKVTPRPNSKQIEELATELSLKAEVVRVWFCNRRQRETRSGNTSVCESVSNCDVTLTSPPVLNPYFAANSLRGAAAAVKADETVSNEKKVKRDETDEKKKKVAVWSEPV